MSGHNFPDWRVHVSGRKKLPQVLLAFSDCLAPETPKYLCAPCSNCKGQFRDMLAYYKLWEQNRILYGVLVIFLAAASKSTTCVEQTYAFFRFGSTGLARDAARG